ncbi:hypothetical protein F4808DRAFT_450340 [Astrocystis sublimbata]|nr:hypothetical protein F4808DRAFT_450340 [Astrocystis sublimbata]
MLPIHDYDRATTPTPANPSPELHRNPKSSRGLTSSPLSSLDTNSSSFATPIAASPDDFLGDDEEDDGDQIAPQVPLQYYKARALAPELKEHCRVYLEEALPRQAIFLLDSLLSTRSPNPDEPAFCPPPSQISLLCSFIVHPDLTTRPKEPDWPEISLQSLAYLKDLLSVFGPVNAGFKESVQFGTHATSDLDLDDGGNFSTGQDADERGLVRLSPRHGNDTVWQRGRDFFGVVGWAFNCAFLYPERWTWWARWLDLMLDILQRDVEERYRLDMENGDDEMPFLKNSILATYISQRSGSGSGRLAGGDAVAWIMRALFADGSAASTSVFQEIWHREHKTKGNKRSLNNKRKRDKVNLDKGEYGGYLDDDVQSSAASEPPTPQKNGKFRSSGLTQEDEDEGEEEVLEVAYVGTIPLRQRLFSTISFLCYALDASSPIDFSSLYQKLEQRVKELPLRLFASFINSSASALRVDQQIEMLQGVLFLFMPPGALSPKKVDKKKFVDGGISPEILERCFLPYPANTIEVEDNAKMSLLLEGLLMMVWRFGGGVGDGVGGCQGGGESQGEGEGKEVLKLSVDLEDIVEKGIEARREKINKKKTRGAAAKGRVVSDAEAEAKSVLEASDARLRFLARAIVEDLEGDVVDED